MVPINKGHEDDLFQSKTLKWKGKLLNVKSVETSSDEESEFYETTTDRSPSPSGWALSPNLAAMRSATPETLRRRSPSPLSSSQWQQEAFLHRKLKEIRKRRTSKINGTLLLKRKIPIFNELVRHMRKALTPFAEVEVVKDLETSSVEAYFSDS